MDAEIKSRNDVGMSQPSNDLCFSFKSFRSQLIPRRFAVNGLDGYRSIHSQLGGFVNRANPALTKKTFNSLTGNNAERVGQDIQQF